MGARSPLTQHPCDPEVSAFLRGDERTIEDVREAIAYVVRLFHLPAPASEADLTQDAMTRVFAGVRTGRYRGEASLRTFAQNVAKYTCLEHMRRARREARARANSADVEGSTLGPEETLIRLEEHGRYLSLFAALPRDSQEMLRLLFVEGLTYREVASRMGVSEGALRVRVHRCRHVRNTNPSVGGAAARSTSIMIRLRSGHE